MEQNTAAESKEDEGVGFLFKAMMERDPKKRRVKPVERHLLQLDFGLDDSEDDSDFEVEEHHKKDESDQSDEETEGESDDEEESTSDDEEDSEEETENSESDKDLSVSDMISKAKSRKITEMNLMNFHSKHTNAIKVLICAVCLGEVSKDNDEIIECDNCGIPVHESCYGDDSEDSSSVETESSTEPWFCDVCKAGVVNPSCELCPNIGGIFKETDAAKWVHLVCALYIGGVAFGDVDKLSPVTLSELQPSKWGARECCYCEDERFSYTGVCIPCDAGMCRNYCHATCAQRAGLLSEASPEEDIADPFYTYCKLHADNASMKRKRQNWLAVQSHLKIHSQNKPNDPITIQRINEKLKKSSEKYLERKRQWPAPWTPPQKTPRMLTTSASACRRLMRKAELLGFSGDQTQYQKSKDRTESARKWNVLPAFSTDFISYYLDRDSRMTQMKTHLDDLINSNDEMRGENQILRLSYDELTAEAEKLRIINSQMIAAGEAIFNLLSKLGGKPLPLPPVLLPHKPKKSPTKKDPSKISTIINFCGICKKTHSQHQLAQCDTCKNHYHLSCLDPPLTRMPKKTAFSAWQCSECVTSDSETSPQDIDEEGDEIKRRKRRVIKEPVKFISQVMPSKKGSKGKLKKRKKVRKPAALKTDDTKEDVDGKGSSSKRPRLSDIKNNCANCSQEGNFTNLVRCDKCKSCYHFGCLTPPLKKSPKQRGYEWFCTDCDSLSEDEHSKDEKMEDDQSVKDEGTEKEDKEKTAN
ncbi:PHD finger protein 14-like [Anneissia japonica]|uniref:PHD finger protein 14-like n=1 Tax=Anneissia japonica TaxID=1529436 RepID=UPI0014259EDF|nr:PHD finger protein 14-like [Anneissia japonica]XP_033099269.1 PHD finger protein 14-like [Anneissia japonica]